MKNTPQKDSIVSEPLVKEFAEGLGVSPAKLLRTLAATVMPEGASGEQVLLFLHLAKKYGLDPLARQISAWPDKRGGIVIVVGVDGWTSIAASHPKFDGVEFRFSDELVNLDEYHRPAPAWCEAVVYRKDRRHPVVVREYLDEVYQPPKRSKDGKLLMGPWQTHTKRMLRHKALIQGLRLAFGLTGIYDPDEAERVQQARAAEEGLVDVDVPRAQIQLPQVTISDVQESPTPTNQNHEKEKVVPPYDKDKNDNDKLSGADRVRRLMFGS